MPLRLIPLARIRPSPDNPASRIDPADPDFVRLRESIRAHGIQEHPVVYECDEPDEYVLLSGHRRVACLKELGRVEATCVVADRPPDAGQAVIRRTVVNIERKAYRPAEFAVLIARIQAEAACNAKQVAEQLGMTPSLVSTYLSLLRLSPEHQAAVDGGEIPMSVGALMAQTDDPKLRERMADMAKAGEPRRSVAAVLQGERPKPQRHVIISGDLGITAAAGLPVAALVKSLKTLLKNAREAEAAGRGLETLTLRPNP